MKLNIIPLTFVAILAVSCSKSDDNNSSNVSDQVKNASTEELQQAVTDRDELITLLNQINDDVVKIKEMERIITIPTGETPNRRIQLLNDINAIKLSLAERQQRLSELEQKLQSSNLYNDQLKQTIASLQAKIEQQTSEITSLTNQLGQATETIEMQSARIDTLNNTITERTTELAASNQTNVDLSNDLNRCYYAIGSKSTLKEQKILESKFLRSSKVLPPDFNRNYFTSADKRTLTEIPTHAKKAKLLTERASDTYSIIQDANGNDVIKITNPDKFWEVSDFLVIQVN